MKYAKLLAAAALAISFVGCSSEPAAEQKEVEKTEDVVTDQDKDAVDKANEEDKVIDENGGQDEDYGTPENSDSDTTEVPTTADEQQAPEQEQNNETNQD